MNYSDEKKNDKGSKQQQESHKYAQGSASSHMKELAHYHDDIYEHHFLNDDSAVWRD